MKKNIAIFLPLLTLSLHALACPRLSGEYPRCLNSDAGSFNHESYKITQHGENINTVYHFSHERNMPETKVEADILPDNTLIKLKRENDTYEYRNFCKEDTLITEFVSKTFDGKETISGTRTIQTVGNLLLVKVSIVYPDQKHDTLTVCQ